MKIIHISYYTILYAGFVNVIDSLCSIPMLCEQKLAYYDVSRNATLFVMHNLQCSTSRLNYGESCVVCSQSENIRKMQCFAHATSSVIFYEENVTASSTTVLLNIATYIKTVGDKPSLDYRDMNRMTNTYFVVPSHSVDFPGIMEIVDPPYGSVIANDLYIGLAYHHLPGVSIESPFQITVSIDGENVREEALAISEGLQFTFEAKGLFQGTYPAQLSNLASGDIEPASWFYSFTPIIPRDNMKRRSPVRNGNSHSESDGRSSAESIDYAKGYSTFGYIEFVLTPQQIQAQRRWVDAHTDQINASYSLEAAKMSRGLFKKSNADTFLGGLFNTFRAPKQSEKVNICIWSSDNMDGQKRIWLDQTEHLNSNNFEFTWIISLSDGRTTADLYQENSRTENIKKPSLLRAVEKILKDRNNGRVIDSPYNNVVLGVDALEMDPEDGRLPVSKIWHGNELELYKYAHESLVLANYSIEHIKPLWCQRFYAILRDALPALQCSAIVYGNERGFSADVLVTDAARILGIPTVGELLNLYVHPDVLPTVLVAPSTFAVEHESIQAVLNVTYAVPAPRRMGGDYPFAVVIPPSVSVDRFDPELYRHMSGREGSGGGLASDTRKRVYRHPGCRIQGNVPLLSEAGNPIKPCIVIGFVARLAPEKNIGLFLQAAYEILRIHPLARFTIVGAGILMPSLQELADRLHIAWAVDFTGWVAGGDLPPLLAGVDIVINPSLRAWSETFCITNIEVMSMEVALVTFAVGGIGEYVKEPTAEDPITKGDQDNREKSGSNHSSDSSNSSDYSVGKNAVVVHVATPTAIAAAVVHLIKDPVLRGRIGVSARHTVLQRFSTARQMKQYEELYSILHEMKN